MGAVMDTGWIAEPATIERGVEAVRGYERAITAAGCRVSLYADARTVPSGPAVLGGAWVDRWEWSASVETGLAWTTLGRCGRKLGDLLPSADAAKGAAERWVRDFAAGLTAAVGGSPLACSLECSDALGGAVPAHPGEACDRCGRER